MVATISHRQLAQVLAMWTNDKTCITGIFIRVCTSPSFQNRPLLAGAYLTFLRPHFDFLKTHHALPGANTEFRHHPYSQLLCAVLQSGMALTTLSLIQPSLFMIIFCPPSSAD